MIRTTVRKIDGAPGAGKTTTIFNEIEEHADNGVPYEDILVVTFTRSARRDAIEELRNVYPSAERREIKKRVRTFHGAAFVSCLDADVLIDGDQLIVQDETPEPYAEFCRKNMLPYNPESTPTRAEIRNGDVGDMAAGNRLFAISDWLALTQRSVEDFPQAPISTQLGYEKVVELLERWDEFKQAGTEVQNDDEEVVNAPYVEHPDYVDLAIEGGLVPGGQYLYADEFQDLSPQEYRLFKGWRESGSFETIVCAGDPEQSIYGFREATPYFFENMPVDDVETRKLTYRVPANIVAVARGILDDHPDTDPRGFRAKDDGGDVGELSVTSPDNLRETILAKLFEHGDDNDAADGFLLSRANHQVKKIASALERAGIPYRQLGSKYQAWTADVSAIYAALKAIDEQRYATVTTTKTLLDHLPDGDMRAAEMFGGAPMWEDIEPDKVFKPEKLEQAVPESPAAIVNDLVDISPKRREILVNAFERRAVANHHPDDLWIGTIHAAKGLEADCVFLFPEITPRVERAYYDDQRNAAEEHRLFYVGVTRARNGLYIMRDYARGPVFPGLRGQLPEVVS